MSDDHVKIKKQSESSMLNCCHDGNSYPYGTSLSFDDDVIDELSAGNLAVGDVVEIRAYAFVDSKSEHSSKEHSSKSIRFQLTSIKVSRETGDIAKQLYGGD